MTCRELIEFLWRYLEDDLPPTERTTFDEHLARCPHCVKYVQSYQATMRIGKAGLAPSEDSVPAEVPEDLIKAILAARPQAT